MKNSGSKSRNSDSKSSRKEDKKDESGDSSSDEEDLKKRLAHVEAELLNVRRSNRKY